MPFADAQGTTVTFDGQLLGSLTGVRASQSVASRFDCTSNLSPVIGTGANTRVLLQVNPTSLDPGAFTIQFLGPTVFSDADIGRVAQLAVSFPGGGSLIGLAYLQDLETDAAVGEKLRGTATFSLTGFT